MKQLYPICRSITGNGVRETLNVLQEEIPVQINEVKSGTKVFDWTVPKEWNIKDAYVKKSNGEKIIDFNKSNLHVINYSIPINKKVSLEELKTHLYTLPDYPEWVPYLTTYYNEDWGFAISHNQYEKLENDIYDVVIDSSLENGFLTYGEYYKEGKIKDEVLLSCYLCHPSLCNDNLSGVVLLTHLAKYISNIDTKYSYRFLFIPETIGAITWLSKNENILSNIKYGLVATCVGDRGNFTYKKTRQGNAEIDVIAEKVLQDLDEDFKIVDFFPSGSDERQFCSPGFNLPVGSLMRTMYGKFPEYHTSADNLEFISEPCLNSTIERYKEIIYIIENNNTYINLNPKCEPQLGKRGLYSKIGGNKKTRIDIMAIFWVLNLSDGNNSLLDISIKSEIKFIEIKKAADILEEHNLIKLK
jgi:aminopeptidase-like protein